MKKFITVFLLLFISAVSLVFVYNKVLSGKDMDSVNEGKISLEDAIIIQGIKMDSHEPLDDESNKGDGVILYDNDFDNISPVKINNKVVKIKDKKTRDFSEMKKKDRRWHVTRYKIMRDDNLWIIARKFNVKHTVIIKYNNITNPNRLLPGKYIDIPNRKGILYSVKRGDSLSRIAGKYNTGISRISKANNLSNSKIRIGMTLFIPDAVKIKKIIKIKNNKKRIRTAFLIKKKEKEKKISKQYKITKKRLRFIWPLRGNITSGFGLRKDPLLRSKKRRFHCGIDISADLNRPVRASAAGRVIFSGWKGPYGRMIVLRHKGGYITVYAHNNKNLVKHKKWVKRGQVIAHSGNSGAVTGAHLHFEIRKYLTPLNPLRLIGK
ncbi:peptidoglycan DD-metalloendopeptidase family protein [Spirochaetota bacterium]